MALATLRLTFTTTPLGGGRALLAKGGEGLEVTRSAVADALLDPPDVPWDFVLRGLAAWAKASNLTTGTAILTALQQAPVTLTVTVDG